MKIRTLVTAAGISLAAAFAAQAQDTVIVAPAQQETIVVTPEQEVLIRDYVTTQSIEPVEKPSNFELVIGAIVPDIFKPGELANNAIPDRNYQYVVIDGRTALIDPETRRVVHIVE